MTLENHPTYNGEAPPREQTTLCRHRRLMLPQNLYFDQMSRLFQCSCRAIPREGNCSFANDSGSAIQADNRVLPALCTNSEAQYITRNSELEAAIRFDTTCLLLRT